MSVIWIDSARLVANPWTPAQITTALWLDASDSSTITTVSGAVSEWRDKSGNARHFGQSTASARPAYTTASGYDVVQFDGTNDHLIRTGSFLPSALADQNFIIMAVVRANTGEFGGVITSNIENDNDGVAIVTNPTQGEFRFFCGGSPGPSATAGANRAIITAVAASAPSQQIWLNGSLSGTSTNNRANRQASTVEIGKYRTAGDPNYSNLNIEEIVIVFNDNTAATRERLEGYAAHKRGLTSGLPAGHPYKSTAP